MSIKIKADSKELLSAFDRLSHIPGANNHPYAQLVKITADVGGIMISRRSPEFYARVTLDVYVQKEGEVTLPYSLLHAVIGRINSPEISISSRDATKVDVIGGSTRALMAVISEESGMQNFPDEKPDCEVTIDAGDLRDWLSVTRKGSLVEPGTDRPFLRGVIFRTTGAQIGINGADGRRIHHIKTGIEGNVDFAIPNDGVSAILKMLDSHKGELGVKFSASRVAIDGSDLDIVCNRVAETAPDFSAMIDLKVDAITNKLTADRKELSDALKACAAMSTVATKQVDIECTPGLATLLSFQGGAFSFNRTIKVTTDKTFQFAANAGFLLDAIDIIPSKEVTIFETERALFIMEEGRIAVVAKMTHGKTRG